MRSLADHALESGVPHGAALVAFAEAIVEGDEAALARTRAAVVDELGAEEMVDAAAVASNFERMVRIADATGIELGDWLDRTSADVRAALGLERPVAE